MGYVQIMLLIVILAISIHAVIKGEGGGWLPCAVVTLILLSTKISISFNWG